MGKEFLKMLTEKKSNSNFVTVECLLAFDTNEDKRQVLALMRKFSSVARVEDRIAKLRKEIGEEKNEHKRNKLRSDLRRLKGELRLLIQFLLDSGESESATQQTANRKMEQLRGSTQVEQKSWQVLSVALALSCIESLRDFSPLKRVIFARDWVGTANRNGLVPLPRQEATVLNMYSFV